MNRILLRCAAAAVALALIAPSARAAEPGYKALSFTQYVNQGYRIPIPQSDVPVRIDLSARIDDKPIGGSMVLSALVTRAPYGGAISWVGTDSDGRVSAGNTAAGDRIVARLKAPDGADYAVLRVDGNHLEVLQKAAAKGSKGYYSVRLWY